MDDEIANVTGSHYTAQFWEYDARVGRRWNIDPVIYPWQSPYACFNNNPIYFSDPSGLAGEDPPKERSLSKQELKQIQYIHREILQRELMAYLKYLLRLRVLKKFPDFEK